ncbi:hypothetical protein RJD11_12165 [Bacillus velezensis]|uniref:hypothetical protein n=1 Tax=Bacillus TaxID=1386 RepID=UPI001C52C5ED|nr:MULTISPECIES: hypothetical protein [Bacillus amyloliquefaciens group]MBV2197440.1 hypothetical protein [Bacillus velezensis]QXP99311.1 hypothetical protein KVY05_21340 [Bacillus velezensis]UHH01347.1 hypothetical protein LUA14_12090 [Bacillus amyloliquefaciens]ULR21095.1 hypothetical protein MJE83_12090 [Bacillus velezensis]UVW07838.1 hypothetical protein NX856_12130 [Bacillus velezensis]
MKKYTDIELEMMKEGIKKELPAMVILIPEVSQVAIRFYDEFKSSNKVNEKDVVSLAVKMTATFLGMDGR